MRVLFTNNTLGERAGSEMYVHDVARQLKRLGHEPVAYSPHLAVVANLLRAEGIPVVRNLADLPFRPDIIHGHHHVETMTALASLPGVPAVAFCHGLTPWEEMPPVFPRILRHVAVSVACRERVVREALVKEEQVRLILNFVDTGVFVPRQPLPARPVRALVFSNSASTGNYAAEVRAACEQCGIALDIRGIGSGKPTNEPQDVLPNYDIVFARGRSAIEAMAVGCAVILCDHEGLGTMVSSANFPELRLLNFGLRALIHPVTVEHVRAAILAYDPAQAAAVRDLIRSQADMRDAVNDLVALYSEVIAENALRRVDPIAELRAMGAYLQTLDSVIKQAPFGTPVIVPPSTVPDAIALPPVRKMPWLRRLFGS